MWLKSEEVLVTWKRVTGLLWNFIITFFFTFVAVSPPLSVKFLIHNFDFGLDFEFWVPVLFWGWRFIINDFYNLEYFLESQFFITDCNTSFFIIVCLFSVSIRPWRTAGRTNRFVSIKITSWRTNLQNMRNKFNRRWISLVNQMPFVCWISSKII